MSARQALGAVLAIVVSFLGLQALTASAQARPDGVPHTYDAAVAHFRHADGSAQSYLRFVTPSGNIYCAMKVTAIPTGCELGQGRIKDPDRCAQAMINSVGRLEFRGGRAVAICNTDTIRTAGAPTLAYGDIAHVPGTHYACLSEAIGVTCLNTAKAEGFFLRKGQYVIFNAG